MILFSKQHHLLWLECCLSTFFLNEREKEKHIYVYWERWSCWKECKNVKNLREKEKINKNCFIDWKSFFECKSENDMLHRTQLNIKYNRSIMLCTAYSISNEQSDIHDLDFSKKHTVIKFDNTRFHWSTCHRKETLFMSYQLNAEFSEWSSNSE